MSPVAIGLLLRALVLLAAAWLAVTMLRRQSASLRALIWTAAFAGILALPLMTSVAPTFEVPVWRSSEAGPSAFAEASAVRSLDRAPQPALEVTHLQETAITPDLKVRPPQDAFIAPVVTREPISWGQIAFVAWALMAFVLMARIAFSHISLSCLARSKDAAHGENDAHDRDWIPLVNQARMALGIRRQVRVRTTDVLGVPAVAGIFKPVLLLPAEAVDWHQETREAVVLHELAHVARWDAAGQLLSQLACALYWCVPLAWHGARRAAVLREQASDDVVLLSGMKASSYAANLLSVARQSGNMSLEPATLAMAHPRRIRERIVAILDPSSTRASLRAGSFAGVTVPMLAVALFVATVQPTTKAAPMPAPPDVSVEPSVVTAPTPATNIIDVARSQEAQAGPSVSAPSAPAISSLPIASAGPVAFGAANGLAAPPPQAASLRGCERDLKETSSSSHSDGKSKYWSVRISGSDCKVDMRVDGEVEFNDTFTDVRSLSRGGAFKLDVTESGVRRELDIEERSGSLNRVYRVDGRERSFDGDGQAWFAQFLITLDRRTAVGVDQRLPVLLRQGGVAAVLKETALMTSDYPRSRYYEKMMEARQLSDGEKAQVLRQAAAMSKSDYYASTLLSQVSKGGYSNTELRTAALAMLDAMDSDYYRSTSVATIVGQGRPTADDMDVLVRTVERIKSDHYKLEVLNRLVGGQLQPQHRAALTRAGRSIESDYYAAEFLKTLAKTGADDGNRQVFFDVIGTIENDHYALEALKTVVGQARLTRTEFSSSLRLLSAMKSDHYRTETVKAILTSSALTEAELLDLVAAIAATGGEYYKSEALLAIVHHRAASDRVRSAVVAASDRLSSHYRDQVRRAAGR